MNAHCSRASAWGPQHPWFVHTLEIDQQHMTYPWHESQWLESATDSYAVFHWANGRELRGFALYHLSPIENLAHLLKIVVVPEARGTGEAVKFWNEQLVMLRAQAFHRVYLEVATSNHPAVRFYSKMGCKMLREVKGFYQDGENAWTMELAI